MNQKSNKQNRIIKLTIVIFCFLLYGNSINNNYALDDNYVTVVDPKSPNPRIQKGIMGIPEIFSTHYIESNNQSFAYRPVVLSTFAIEYQLFKSNPQISHFINVSIYAITCVLLFVILSSILSGYHIVFPLLITFLFIAHPIHSEVVNNLKSRDELLAFLFGISSLFFFLKRINTGKWKYLIWAMLLFLLALLSKRSAILFIAIIPITIYFFTSMKLKNVIIYSFIPLVLFFAYKIFMLLMFHDSASLREYAFFENPLFYETNFFTRIPMAFYTAGYYIKLLVFPHPLSCYYGFKAIPLANWTFVSVWISLLFHFSIGIYAILKFSKKSILSYSIIIYLIGIFPFSNLYTPVVGIIGERFVYLASLGFCISIAYLLILLFKIEYLNKTIKWKNNKFLFKTTCVFILFLFSIKIISRNTDWKDKVTLFRNDVKQMEDSYFLNYFTANTIYQQLPTTPNGRKKDLMIAESQKHFKIAAELLKEGLKSNKTDYYTMSSLGTIYVNYLNDIDAAIPWFKKSLAINPDYDVAQYNLIFCYEKRNLPDSALLFYEKMIAGGTKYLPVYFQLHELYISKNEYSKAIKINKNILLEYPDEIKLYINLGNAYMLNKDTLIGMKYFEEAAAKPPLDYVLLQNVSNVFKAIGNNDKAVYYQEKSKRVMYQTGNH